MFRTAPASTHHTSDVAQAHLKEELGRRFVDKESCAHHHPLIICHSITISGIRSSGKCTEGGAYHSKIWKISNSRSSSNGESAVISMYSERLSYSSTHAWRRLLDRKEAQSSRSIDNLSLFNCNLSVHNKEYNMLKRMSYLYFLFPIFEKNRAEF